jgi:hypothetical protein
MIILMQTTRIVGVNSVHVVDRGVFSADCRNVMQVHGTRAFLFAN